MTAPEPKAGTGGGGRSTSGSPHCSAAPHHRRLAATGRHRSLRPGPDDHLGPYARHLGARGDVAELMAMLDAEGAGRARRCCVAAVRGEIHALAARPDSLASEPVTRMSQEWWDSSDDWKCMVAVMARSSGDRRLLLSKVDLSRPAVARAAVEGLSGPGDAEEIAVLGRVVSSPQPALSDDDPLVRAHAVTALSRLGDRAAALSRLDDPDPRVRTAARYARRTKRSRMSYG